MNKNDLLEICNTIDDNKTIITQINSLENLIDKSDLKSPLDSEKDNLGGLILSEIGVFYLINLEASHCMVFFSNTSWSSLLNEIKMALFADRFNNNLFQKGFQNLYKDKNLENVYKNFKAGVIWQKFLPFQLSHLHTTQISNQLTRLKDKVCYVFKENNVTVCNDDSKISQPILENEASIDNIPDAKKRVRFVYMAFAQRMDALKRLIKKKIIVKNEAIEKEKIFIKERDILLENLPEIARLSVISQKHTIASALTNSFPIVIMNWQQYYTSFPHAALELGLPKKTIENLRSLRHASDFEIIEQAYLEFYNNDDNLVYSKNKENKVYVHSRRISIDDKIYMSIADARRQTGISQTKLKDMLKKKTNVNYVD